MSESNKQLWKNIINIISLLIVGFGIGWLAGLSESPVASIVISALLGVAIIIAGIVAGIKILNNGSDFEILESAKKISIGAFALLVVGIVAGVSVGIYMRENNTLGVEVVEKEEKEDDSLVRLQKDFDNLQSIYDSLKLKNNEQVKLYLGLERREIALRILDKYYPKDLVKVVNKSEVDNSSSDKTNEISSTGAGLRSSVAEIPLNCKRILEEKSMEDLKKAIKDGNVRILRGLPEYVDDENMLRSIVTIICEELYRRDKK